VASQSAILGWTEIKTVPYVPLSHPFVERLIGRTRREYLDRTLFWTTSDLQNKLLDFRLADLILSLPPSAFRNCDPPHLASGHRQNRSTYQFAIGENFQNPDLPARKVDAVRERAPSIHADAYRLTEK
jgi:hypothetical protein